MKLTARGERGIVEGGSVNGALGDMPRGGLNGPVRGLTAGMFMGGVCAENFGGVGGIAVGGESKSGTRAGDAVRGGVNCAREASGGGGIVVGGESAKLTARGTGGETGCVIMLILGADR